MKTPLVSCIITTYDKPNRISSALETVLNQTYQDFEIILVDGSNLEANQIEVARYQRYDHRIRYIQVEPEAVNMFSMFGVQHARNVGCRNAKGKYVAMLDDDDLWNTTKLEKQVKIFEAFDELEKMCLKGTLALVLCYSKIIFLSNNKEFVDKPMHEPDYNVLLQSFNLSSTSTFMIRRDILEEIGGWNETLRGAHEYDIALKIAKLKYEIYTIPEVLMIKTRSFESASRSNFIKIAEVFDFWKHYGKDIIPNVGVRGFLFDVSKTLGLFFFFSLGYIFKEKSWDILFKLKALIQPRD